MTEINSEHMPGSLHGSLFDLILYDLTLRIVTINNRIQEKILLIVGWYIHFQIYKDIGTLNMRIRIRRSQDE